MNGEAIAKAIFVIVCSAWPWIIEFRLILWVPWVICVLLFFSELEISQRDLVQRLVKHRSSLHLLLARKIFSTLEDATGKLHLRHNLSKFETLAAPAIL